MGRATMRGKLLLAAGAVLLFGTAGIAGPPSDVVHTVTLQEAVASADRAPELIAARAGERAAEAAIRVSRAFPDPAVSFATNSVTARESLSASLPFPWPSRGPRIDAARADLEAAGRTRESARASARRELRVAWFALAAAEERARASADREARAMRNAQAIAALFEEGRAPRLERVRGEAEAALARADRASAEGTRETAGATLAALMGLEPGLAVTAGEAHMAPGPEGALEDSLARARNASPEVRLQAARADAATARWKLARRLRIPGVGLDVGVDWNDPTNPGTTNTRVGLSVNVPLAGSATAAVALAERDRELALLTRERREAGTAAEAAWRTSRAARLRFEAMEKELLPAAREAAELTGLAYREGKVDVFRLLDAERVLSEAEVARADAYEAWGVADADLLRTTAEDER